MPRNERAPIIIGGNDRATVKLLDAYRNDLTREVMYHHELPDARGTFMLALIERWGIVAATRGAEDNCGRAAHELLDEHQVVKRAGKITAFAFEELERRGWLVKLERPQDEAED